MEYSNSQLNQSLKKLTKSNVLIQEAKVIHGTYHADSKSVDVIPLTAAFGTKVSDVRIKAKFIFDPFLPFESDPNAASPPEKYVSPILEGGVEYIPSDGSNVIIGFIDGFEHEAIILAYSNLQKIQMTVEENRVEKEDKMYVEEHRFSMDKNEIQLKNITRSVLDKKADDAKCDVESTEEIIKNEIRLDKTQIVLQQYDPEEGRMVVKQFSKSKEPAVSEAEKRESDPPLSQVIIDKEQIVINHYDADNNLISQALVNADGLRFTKNQSGSAAPQTKIEINDSGALLNHYDGQSDPNTQIKLEKNESTITTFSGGQVKNQATVSNTEIKLKDEIKQQEVSITSDGITVSGLTVNVQGVTSLSLAAPSISMAPSGGPGGPGSISLNGGGKGGLVDIQTLVDKIQALEQAINTHTHPVPQLGTSLPTADGLIAPLTTRNELENKNITHG
ncbi:MAG: hypothetical protein ACPGJS_05480 [Flammeovirgaceae bacterium]